MLSQPPNLFSMSRSHKCCEILSLHVRPDIHETQTMNDNHLDDPLTSPPASTTIMRSQV